MDSMDDQHGFDALFISETPEYLRCILCHLVLRNTVQILKCGHKFCRPCFERLKAYSENMNTQLCCPMDREVIDIKNVFADKGMDRVVGNLIVKCANSEAGCIWKGDLRDVKGHEEKCEHGVLKKLSDESSISGNRDSTVLNELCQRMNKCEEALIAKEKDVASLKFNLHEVKSTFNEKLLEIGVLKEENKHTKNELKLIKEQNQDLKQVEIKVESVLLKNAILEQKVDNLENQSLVTKEQLGNNKMCIEEALIEKEKDVAFLKFNLHEVKSTFNEKLMEIDVLKEENKHTKNELKLIKEQNQDLKQVKIKVESVLLKNAILEQKVDNLENRSLVTKESSSQLITKKRTESKILCNNQNLFEDLQRNIKDLEHHITNIENNLFLDVRGRYSEDIVLEWNLQNYQYHFDIGEGVCSPVFFTQLKGYRFQLSFGWSGNEKENSGIDLRLFRACNNNDKELEPFNVPFSFEVPDTRGNIRSEKVALTKLEEHRKDCFTISPGKDHAEYTYGFSTFLTMPDVWNYIINDSICIRCRLTPS